MFDNIKYIEIVYIIKYYYNITKITKITKNIDKKNYRSKS